ncbi:MULTISPECIES: BREX system ATP-binding domain-containing protein [unclassified Streptomyces]|uniref:BREX system ATP-binding domain-containing protein n=1 Tax=unclassified Streptomyces TaxID=2593676 RepID=UPI00235DCDE9|nr:LuxR family transcriptional regulator [Streptomyces sp. MMBL 11-1]
MPQELFGRSAESKIVVEMLESAKGGVGSVALVEGIIGTGKTSFLRWAEQTAREQGMVILSATASPTEQHFSLGVVHQLLGTLPETAQKWDAAFASGGAPSGGGPDIPDYALLAELCAGLGRAARRAPVLLTVDCVQHADSRSLLWLGFLGRRLDNLPVVLLATKRCGEPALDQHLLVEIMEGVRPDRHIHLHDLSPSAALDLAVTLRGQDHGSVAALVADTGGNPYLLTEQLRTASTHPSDRRPAEPSGEGLRPGAVRERILCLLRRLGPHGLAIARAASILRTPLEPSILAALCGVPTEDACHTLTRLTESGLLCAERMTFRHPVLAGLLYEDIPCAERGELHRLAACFMRRHGASCEDIAAHLLHSHRLDEPWMVRLLLDVAQGMVGRDPSGARRLIDRAVLHGVPEEHAAHAEALRIQTLTALDLPASARALTAHAAGACGPVERFREALRLSDIHLRLDDPACARQALEQALRASGTPDPATAARLRERFTRIRIHEGTYRHGDGVEDRLERVLLLRTATGDSAAAVRRIADRILTVPRTPYGSTTWYHALLAQLWAGDVDEAGRHMDTEVRLAHAEGTATRIVDAHAVRGLVQLHRGQLAEAEHDARTALELLTSIHADKYHVGALTRSVLIDVALERGDIAMAGALLDEAPMLLGEQPGTWWRLHLLHSAGRALGRMGQAQQGLTLLARCGEELTRRGIVNPAILPWLSSLSTLRLSLRNVAAARSAAREETERAQRWGAPLALGRALTAQASAGSGSEALQLAERAVELLEPTPAPLVFAHALFAAGSAQRRSGKVRRTRELLHRANEVAISLGADGLVEAVQQELRHAGGRPDPRKDSAESLLTPTERQVSELAARGLSNRGIAQLLKVSLRNVESHLTHSYRKLRINGRHELARFFPADAAPVPAAVLLHQPRPTHSPQERLRTG